MHPNSRDKASGVKPDQAMTIRPAQPEDAAEAAELILASTGRFGEMLFGGGDQRRAAAAIAGFFRYPDNRFSYRLTRLAVIDGQTAGLLLAFPGAHLERLTLPLGRQMWPVLGAARSLWMMLYSLPIFFNTETVADEYYVAHLAVAAAFRRQGIGRRLLETAEQQAEAASLRRCALIVALDNQPARNLYQRLGYTVVKSVHTPWLQWAGYGPGEERRVKLL